MSFLLTRPRGDAALWRLRVALARFFLAERSSETPLLVLAGRPPVVPAALMAVVPHIP
jgi:hypothetical protein